MASYREVDDSKQRPFAPRAADPSGEGSKGDADDERDGEEEAEGEDALEGDAVDAHIKQSSLLARADEVIDRCASMRWLREAARVPPSIRWRVGMASWRPCATGRQGLPGRTDLSHDPCVRGGRTSPHQGI